MAQLVGGVLPHMGGSQVRCWVRSTVFVQEATNDVSLTSIFPSPFVPTSLKKKGCRERERARERIWHLFATIKFVPKEII